MYRERGFVIWRAAASDVLLYVSASLSRLTTASKTALLVVICSASLRSLRKQHFLPNFGDCCQLIREEYEEEAEHVASGTLASQTHAIGLCLRRQSAKHVLTDALSFFS